MGTYDLGEDVQTRVFRGARGSLVVGVIFVAIMAVIRSVLGPVAAFGQRHNADNERH